MATVSSPPSDSVLEAIRAGMQESITKACEPIIEKAVKDCEAVVRERVAQMVISRIDHSYSVERNGNILQIRVLLGKEM